jgi:hypothetical protein
MTPSEGTFMHDLDRQQLEHDYDRQQLEQQEQASEHGELTEAQELALAAEALEVASEEELEQFLGNLWDRAKAAVSPATRQALIDTGKAAGRYFLPALAGIGAEKLSPGHGYGPMAAAATKMVADQWLKEELEGLSAEDREFEIARRYVRLIWEAIMRAAQGPPDVPAPIAARVAMAGAARQQAPGLVPFLADLPRNGGPSHDADGDTSTGSWVRHGSSIVIDLG